MDNPISEFFETTDFAQSVTYTPSGGSSVSILGIFDNEFSLNDISEMGYQNMNPYITCKTSDVNNATNGDTFVISSVTYYVIGVQPDGTGITRIILSKNSNGN